MRRREFLGGMAAAGGLAWAQNGAAPGQALFQTRVAEGVTAYRTHYIPTRDGQRFLINTQTSDPPQASVTVVLNWKAGLKK